MRLRRTASSLSLLLVLAGTAACSEDDAQDGVDQVEEGVQDGADEVEEQIEEGGEEDGEG